MRFWKYGSVFFLLASLGGCLEPSAKIPAQTAEPLKAHFDYSDSAIADRKYVLIPIRADEAEFDKVYGSMVFSSSCWSGTCFGKLGSPSALNLEVIELDKHEHHRVFDRQVALGSWRMSFDIKDDQRLLFADQLILPARTTDSDKNGTITSKDSVYLYFYDLKKHQTRMVSPAGYHVADVKLLTDQVVVTVEPENDHTRSALYVYDPAKDQGNFVVENLTP